MASVVPQIPQGNKYPDPSFLDRVPRLNLKIQVQEESSCLFSGGYPFYLSSHGLSSHIHSNIDDRIQYLVSISNQLNSAPFGGYSISIMRIPGYRYLDQQKRFYTNRFQGAVVAIVNFRQEMVDGVQQWVTWDETGKRTKTFPHELVLEFDLVYNGKFWQKKRVYHKKLTCCIEMVSTEDYNQWKPYFLQSEDEKMAKLERSNFFLLVIMPGVMPAQRQETVNSTHTD